MQRILVLAALVLSLGERCDAFESKAARRQLSLQRHWPHDCTVTADRQFLLVIVNNLLDNAVSHADPGGQIQLNASEQEKQVVLEISNCDSRLSAADIEHIFERFWRGDASRSQTGRHAGLGLGLCQKLLTLMNGSISAEKRDGQFKVSIYLPPSSNFKSSSEASVRVQPATAAC